MVSAALNDLLPFDDDRCRIRLRAHVHHLSSPRAGPSTGDPNAGLTGSIAHIPFLHLHMLRLWRLMRGKGAVH